MIAILLMTDIIPWQHHAIGRDPVWLAWLTCRSTGCISSCLGSACPDHRRDH